MAMTFTVCPCCHRIVTVGKSGRIRRHGHKSIAMTGHLGSRPQGYSHRSVRPPCGGSGRVCADASANPVLRELDPDVSGPIA